MKVFQQVFRKLRNAETPFTHDIMRNAESTCDRTLHSTKVLYLTSIPMQGESGYELIFRGPFLKEYSLMVCDNETTATQHMNELAQVFQWFDDFIRLHQKDEAFIRASIIELLQCHSANPQWTVAHYVANFACDEEYFRMKPLIPPEDHQILEGTFSGSSLLHAAIASENETIVGQVLQMKVNVSVCDEDGWTAMHYAVSCESHRMVALLIEKPHFSSQLLRADKEGCTPFDLTFKNGQLVIRQIVMETLLKDGVLVQMLNKMNPTGEGITFTEKEVAMGFLPREVALGGCPLHWVDDFDLLDKLLKMKAFSVNKRNSLGDTPLIALVKRCGSGPPHLEGANSKATSRVQSSLAQGQPRHRDRLSYLLRLFVAGGRINAQNRIGNSALHYTVANQDVPSLQMLIIFGARINLLNSDEQSALHLACTLFNEAERNYRSTFQMLQEKARSLTSKVQTGKSPQVAQVSGAMGESSVVPERTWTAAAKEDIKIIIGLLLECGARKCSAQMVGCTQCAINGSTPAPGTPKEDEVVITGSTELLDKYFQLYFNEQTLAQMKVASNKNNQTNPEASTNPTVQIQGTDEVEGEIIQSHTQGATKEDQPLASGQSNANEVAKKDSLTSVESLPENKPMQTIGSVERRPVNLLIFDGGDTEEFARPLIQALILDQIQKFVPRRSLILYFDVLAGVSFGGTAGALLIHQKTPLEIFSFFLQLKEDVNIKRGLTAMNIPANSEYLEKQLKSMFEANADMLGVKKKVGPPEGKKHLMLFTALIDREPIVQKVLHSLPEIAPFDESTPMLLWEACRAASCGLYCYTTYKGHYDGALYAANPTLDTLTYYEACRLKLDIATNAARESALPPIGLVLSLGCGSKHVKENQTVRDTPAHKMNIVNIVSTLGFIGSMRNNLLRAMLEQDSHVAERALIWCETLRTNYVRINFPFAKAEMMRKNGKTANLIKATSGLFRSSPAVPEKYDDGTLLQTLWTIKLEMMQSKGKFLQLAHFLEMSQQSQSQGEACQSVQD